MKLFLNKENQILCDVHTSSVLQKNMNPLTVLEVWELVKKEQKHYSQLCIKCNGGK